MGGFGMTVLLFRIAVMACAPAEDGYDCEAAHRRRTTLPASDCPQLKIVGHDADYTFGFDAGKGWQMAESGPGSSLPSTDVAEGSIGAVVGPHARIAPKT